MVAVMTTNDTEDTTMSDATTVDTYLAMWNEPDSTKRAALIEAAWAEGCRYLDPLLEADGYAGLSEMVETVHGHYPGHRFRRTTGIDRHHDQLRFGWELFAPDGTVTVAGLDVCDLAADGRIQRITGFFGDLTQDVAA
jgi:hypothetical protein